MSEESLDTGFVRSWPATIILGVLTAGAIIYAASNWGQAEPSNADDDTTKQEEVVIDAGARTQIGVDKTIAQSGDGAVYIKVADDGPLPMLPAGWMAAPEQSQRGLLQFIKADNYRGKRIRLTASLKTKDIDPGTGLWMRVDGAERMLAVDSMSQRLIKGTTDWADYSSVLDVPADAIGISYGVRGLNLESGQVWADDFMLETVGTDVEVTCVEGLEDKIKDYSPVYQKQLADRYGHAPLEPTNLGFEDGVEYYKVGIDSSVAHSGEASACIELVVTKDKPKDGLMPKEWNRPSARNVLMQFVKADEYQGKRVRMSAYVKTEKQNGWAGLWLRVDGETHRLTFDNQWDRPILGTNNWKKYEIVLDVADDALGMAYGLVSSGKGKAWVDDITFEIVDDSVKTTGSADEAPKVNPGQYARTVAGYAEAGTKPANLNFEAE